MRIFLARAPTHKRFPHFLGQPKPTLSGPDRGVITKGVFALEESLESLKFSRISRKWSDSPFKLFSRVCRFSWISRISRFSRISRNLNWKDAFSKSINSWGEESLGWRFLGLSRQGLAGWWASKGGSWPAQISLQEAFGALGPKDLLHPLLTTFGIFLFSGPLPEHLGRKTRCLKFFFYARACSKRAATRCLPILKNVCPRNANCAFWERVNWGFPTWGVSHFFRERSWLCRGPFRERSL